MNNVIDISGQCRRLARPSFLHGVLVEAFVPLYGTANEKRP